MPASKYKEEANNETTLILSTHEIVKELLNTLHDAPLRYRLQVLWYLYAVIGKKKLGYFLWHTPGLRIAAAVVTAITPIIRIRENAAEHFNSILLTLITLLTGLIAVAKVIR